MLLLCSTSTGFFFFFLKARCGRQSAIWSASSGPPLPYLSGVSNGVVRRGLFELSPALLKPDYRILKLSFDPTQSVFGDPSIKYPTLLHLRSKNDRRRRESQ